MSEIAIMPAENRDSGNLGGVALARLISRTAVQHPVRGAAFPAPLQPQLRRARAGLGYGTVARPRPTWECAGWPPHCVNERLFGQLIVGRHIPGIAPLHLITPDRARSRRLTSSSISSSVLVSGGATSTASRKPPVAG
jgi:hypothetical protein